MYDRLRNYPLNVVLGELGFDVWKWRKEGTEGYGRCPICLPKKNTTAFSFTDDGKFHCFSCGAKGKGALDLVIAIRKCSFKDAVSFLEGLSAAISLEPVQTPAKSPTPPITQNPAFKASYENYAVPSEWLQKRGFTETTLKHFGVFQYDNPKRSSVYKGKILLPVRRLDGELVAYLARNTREGPKYIWPKGFAKHLEIFGAWHLKNAHAGALPLRLIYLVESPFSVMRFHQLGFPAVSCFGWSVSYEQAVILGGLARGIVYLPDADKRDEAVPYSGMLSTYIWVKMPQMPVSDPEQLSYEQIRALS